MFYFSPINASIVSNNPLDSLNLLWNQQLESSRANSLNYMIPVFNVSSFSEFPQYNMFGNSLIDPLLAVRQTIQSFQNNTWANWPNGNYNGTNGLSNSGFWGNPFQLNWGNPFQSNTTDGAGGAKTDEEKAAQKTMQGRYDKLKAVLTQYQKIATEQKLGTDESRNKISVAINKSGTLEERYNALQEAYKTINSADLRKAFLSKPEVLKDLTSIGYNFTDRTYHYGNEGKDDTALLNALDKLEKEITQKGSDKDSKQVTSNMVDRAQLYKSDNIMRTISYWNDTHNTDKDRSIVRLMINNLTSDKAAYISNNIQPLSEALTNHANDTIQELKSLNVGISELEAQSKKVKEYFNTKNLASINLNAFADDFDKLYAMLRKADALKINKKYVSDYQFLNDISDKDTDFINDQLIVKDTEADLAKEGLGNIKTTFSVVNGDPNGDNPQITNEEVEELVSNGTLKKAIDPLSKKEVPNCYTDSNKNIYTLRNGELVKLDSAKSVFANGRCQQKNGRMCYTKDAKGTVVEPSSLSAPAKKLAEEKTETPEQQAERLSSENPRLLGVWFCEDISGYTDENDFARMTCIIKNVNESNVEEFLKGYYDTYDWFDNGFFEQIAAEEEDVRLTNEEVVKVMEAIVNKYKGTKLSDEKEKAFAIVNDTYEKYKNDTPTALFSNKSTACARFLGFDILDKLDDAVEILIKQDA